MSQCQLSRDKYDSGGADYAPGGKILAFFFGSHCTMDVMTPLCIGWASTQLEQHQAGLKVPSHMRARTYHSASFISSFFKHVFYHGW